MLDAEPTTETTLPPERLSSQQREAVEMAWKKSDMDFGLLAFSSALGTDIETTKESMEELLTDRALKISADIEPSGITLRLISDCSRLKKNFLLLNTKPESIENPDERRRAEGIQGNSERLLFLLENAKKSGNRDKIIQAQKNLLQTLTHLGQLPKRNDLHS